MNFEFGTNFLELEILAVSFSDLANNIRELIDQPKTFNLKCIHETCCKTLEHGKNPCDDDKVRFEETSNRLKVWLSGFPPNLVARNLHSHGDGMIRWMMGQDFSDYKISARDCSRSLPILFQKEEDANDFMAKWRSADDEFKSIEVRGTTYNLRVRPDLDIPARQQRRLMGSLYGAVQKMMKDESL